MLNVIDTSNPPVATRKTLVRMNKKLGKSWREIGAMYDVNQKYVYDWAVHGIRPANQEVRYRMQLERRPVSEANRAWLKAAVDALRKIEIPQPIIGPRVYDNRGRRVVLDEAARQVAEAGDEIR